MTTPDVDPSPSSPSFIRTHGPTVGGRDREVGEGDATLSLDEALIDARRAIHLFLDGETEASRKIVEPL